jgi:hypothetical protein
MIEDNKTGETGRFTGQGVFTPSQGNTLAYTEEGELQIGDYSDTVHRRYLYHFANPDKPHVAHVRYEDGREFHDLDFSQGHHTARHDCPPDVYEGVFQVISHAHWQIRWAITGPRKDMCITTDLKRT